MDVLAANQFYSVFDHIPLGICVLERDFSVIYWNSFLEEWTGIPRETIRGKSVLSFFDNLNQPRYYERIKDIFAGGAPLVFSSQIHKYIFHSPLPDNTSRVQETLVMPLKKQEEKGYYALFSVQDVTDLTHAIETHREIRDRALKEIEERKRFEKKLVESEERYKLLVNLAPMGIIIVVDERVVFINPAGIDLLGAKSEDEVVGRRFVDFIHPENLHIDLNTLEVKLADNIERPNVEKRIFRFDGESTYVSINKSKFMLNGEPAEQIIFEDISKRKEAERKLHHLAHYDQLTNIPNRLLFFDRLEQVLENAKRYDTVFALLYLDLDGFKLINDSLGHDAGDELLRQSVSRMLSCLRRSDTLARMGGDEFTIILSQLKHEEDVHVVARRIVASLNRTFEILKREVHVGVSVGVGIFPRDGKTSEGLIQCADTAMYHSKYAGKNTYTLFSDMAERIAHSIDESNNGSHKTAPPSTNRFDAPEERS